MSEQVSLRFYQTQNQSFPVTVLLPEITGKQELNVQGVDTHCAVSLLSDLFKEQSTDDSLDIEQLTASDRDKLLVSLHRNCWGDKIISTVYCENCEQPFDLTFKLSQLQEHLFVDGNDWELVGNATVKSGDKINLTIPVASQEQALSAFSEQEALSELIETLGITTEQIESIAKQLEQAAPIIDLDLDATCPECSVIHKVAFDIQSFVLQRLINGREQILMDVHQIASSYSWSLTEILSLDRSTRKSIVGLIDDIH